MKVLVLGSQGMLGHALVSCWNKEKGQGGEAVDSVVGLDLPDLDLGNRLTTIDSIELLRPDVIINAAGITNINWLESHPNSARTVHIQGTAAIRDAADRTAALLVQISCAEVLFRKEHDGPAPNEEVEPDPQSVFGKTKRESERIALEHSPSLVVRTGTLFDDLRPNGAGNIVETVLRVSRRTRRFSVISDLTTSLTGTRDFVRGLQGLISRNKRGLWHVAGRGTPTLAEIAAFILAERALSDHEILPITLAGYGHQAEHSRSTTLSVEKYHSDSSLPPLPHWKDALHDYLQK